MSLETFNPSFIQLSQQDWRCLLEVARHAIKYGLSYHIPPPLELEKYPESVKQQAASFVTLRESNVMRGCIGSVHPHLPLVQDVANHTFASAFQDKRFAPINHIEEPVVHISISLVSQLIALDSANMRQSIEFIEKNQCGVVLSHADKQATYLPEVWQQVANGHEFVTRLKSELGLASDEWNDEIQIHCYQVQTID